MRSDISAAAFSVKVMVRMRSGSIPSATSPAKRSTRTSVLPDPAPAATTTSPPRASIARVCAGVRSGFDTPRR